MAITGAPRVVKGKILIGSAGAEYITRGYLRAYDAETGEEIWKYPLPVGASATPMSYISPVDNRQYVVVSVGGAAHSKDVGDYVMAFALRK